MGLLIRIKKEEMRATDTYSLQPDETLLFEREVMIQV